MRDSGGYLACCRLKAVAKRSIKPTDPTTGAISAIGKPFPIVGSLPRNPTILLGDPTPNRLLRRFSASGSAGLSWNPTPKKPLCIAVTAPSSGSSGQGEDKEANSECRSPDAIFRTAQRSAKKRDTQTAGGAEGAKRMTGKDGRRSGYDARRWEARLAQQGASVMPRFPTTYREIPEGGGRSGSGRSANQRVTRGPPRSSGPCPVGNGRRPRPRGTVSARARALGIPASRHPCSGWGPGSGQRRRPRGSRRRRRPRARVSS